MGLAMTAVCPNVADELRGERDLFFLCRFRENENENKDR